MALRLQADDSTVLLRTAPSALFPPYGKFIGVAKLSWQFDRTDSIGLLRRDKQKIFIGFLRS
jgi:hypothetical protein